MVNLIPNTRNLVKPSVRNFIKAVGPRNINNLASFDLNFSANTYKGGTMSFSSNPSSNLLTQSSGFNMGSVYAPNSAGVYSAGVNGCLRRTDVGLWVQQNRTNVVLWCRDLTNAAWTKTNVTAAKNQTGITGVANSASSITASAGNGTVLQSITLASSVRYQSAFVKRISGTGTLEMTMDGGTTWTTLTVTSSWTRAELTSATLANPNVGFRIGTNGDSFAIDFVQNENGNTVSNPILTTTASVQSWGDIPRCDISQPNTLAELVQAGYGFYIECFAVRPEQFGFIKTDGWPDSTVNVDGSTTMNNAASLASAFTRGYGVINRVCGYVNSNGSSAISVNGGAVRTGTTTVSGTITHFVLGSNGSQGMSMHGCIARVAFFPSGALTTTDIVNFSSGNG